MNKNKEKIKCVTFDKEIEKFRNESLKKLEKIERDRLKYNCSRGRANNYGITQELYNEMFEEQQGKCKICGLHQSELNSVLNIDHDHNTNEIRGLLCRPCNTALGGFKDSVVLLESAIRYLNTDVSKNNKFNKKVK